MPLLFIAKATWPCASMRDQGALATECADVRDRVVGGQLHAFAVPGHAVAQLARGRGTNEEFAVTGGRDGAHFVLGVGACADDRRIADASPALAGRCHRSRSPPPDARPGRARRRPRCRRHGCDRAARRSCRATAGTAASAPRCGSSPDPPVPGPAAARKHRRPCPASMTCLDFSITARARLTGFLVRVTPATAPAWRVRPSMIEASSSLRPSAVNTAPLPALNSGSSSRTLHHRLDGIEAGAAAAQDLAHRLPARH